MVKSHCLKMQNIGRGIWRSSSKIKGPHVTLLGGIHGNELVGIHIIRRFQETCLPLVAGTLTVILGNPLAIESGTRGSRPHFDLNRCFSSDNLLNSNSNFEKDNENYEMTRARELAPYLAECDVMIDLHSTNKPSLPFIRIAGEIAKNMDVNSDTNIVNLILQYLPCDILLTDPTYLLAGHVSLTDEYVGACNGVGICYESGVASDLNAVDKVYDSLVCILKKFKMIDQNNIQTTTIPCFPPSQYTLSTVFNLTSQGFTWADGVGQYNFQCIPPNQVIGYHGTKAFIGSLHQESFIVFPKISELWKIGSPLGWIAHRT